MITLGVFVLGYLYCLTQFPGFASTRVICNILTDNAFLGIIAVGMTFVILSGGIAYTVGAARYGVGHSRHIFHTVFHVFVVAGSLLQAVGILLYAL